MFKGKIFCFVCGKKHKYKKRSSKPIYVCSTYDNYGSKSCIRNHVNEEDLIWFIFGHFSINRKDVTTSFVNENILKIVTSDEIIKIFYVNGEESLLTGTQLIR